MSEPTLNQLKEAILEVAKEKGWGISKEDIDVPEKIALIHSEVSEAFEAYRHKNIDEKDGFKEELADVMIRVLHLCATQEIDIHEEVLKKLEVNKTREWKWEKMNENHS